MDDLLCARNVEKSITKTITVLAKELWTHTKRTVLNVVLLCLMC